MAKIIIDGHFCTTVKEAILKMMDIYNISRNNAICYLIFDMNFKNNLATNDFISEIENIEEISENIFCETFIEMYLNIPEAEDIRYKVGDNVYPIGGFSELMY